MKQYLFLLAVISLSTFAQEDAEIIPLLTNQNGKPEIIQEARPLDVTLEMLEELFLKPPSSPTLPDILRKHSVKFGPKSVPVLIKVMKEDKFPEENRWHATILLAQIMGKSAVPFIAKFTEHPHWMLRTAALKAMLGLGEGSRIEEHRKSLSDSSLIVRTQALDNVNKMKMKTLAPDVWVMMFNEENYSGDSGNRKRLTIFKDIVRTLGDLEYEPAKGSFEKLVFHESYKDLKEDLIYALSQFSKSKQDELKDLESVLAKKPEIAPTPQVPPILPQEPIATAQLELIKTEPLNVESVSIEPIPVINELTPENIDFKTLEMN